MDSGGMIWYGGTTISRPNDRQWLQQKGKLKWALFCFSPLVSFSVVCVRAQKGGKMSQTLTLLGTTESTPQSYTLLRYYGTITRKQRKHKIIFR
jgi:hypothetical protein